MSYLNNLTVKDCKYGGLRPSTAFLMDMVMVHMTAGEVKKAVGGELLSGSEETPLSGVSIDTRTMQPSDLYFAIRGPRNDGHAFIEAALQKGALGVVVDRRFSPPADFPANKILLRVDDTHAALKRLAAEVRRRWRGSLVAVTGSMGKTTTKEFLAQILQTEYGIYGSPGNYNNLFGLPLAIFGLSPEDHIGVFEMGMSAPGEIAEMCRIARPDVGVLTNVAPVHLEFFGTLGAIARAKAELAEGLAPEGTLIYNADDPEVRKIAAGFAGERISFGTDPEADVRAENVTIGGLHETRFRLSLTGVSYPAAIPLCGTHYVMNALAAVAAALHYRMDPVLIVESLRHLRAAQMRGRILRFKKGFTVVDDSYNSNPRALVQMIETVSALPGFDRRILIAGEMLELGPDAPELHRRCGLRAGECGMDIVVGIQGAAVELVRGAIAAGVPDMCAHFFTEVDPVIDFVSRKVQPGDLVLIKGSRGVHLERINQALRSEFSEQAD